MVAQNQYLDYLIDPSFQGVNRLSVLSYEDNAVRTGHTGYFLPTPEIKDYGVFFYDINFTRHKSQIAKLK